MGGILSESQENEIIKLIRKDNARSLQEYLEYNQVPKDILYTNHKRTLIQLSCYFESPKCLSKLIEMNYDYNKIETLTGNTPLFIASKFNNLEMVQILLANDDCKKLVKNLSNLNEFDIAFLKGNYNICYYLMYEYKNRNNDNINGKDDNNINNEIFNAQNQKNEEVVIINKAKGKSNTKENKEKKENKESEYDIHQIYQSYFYNTSFEYDYFLTLQAENKYPLFNMPLFFKCLCNKTPPSKCPSFAPEHKKTQDLMNKIPDPNETWGHFFKRVASMELYNPPLVDKKNVSVMNSMYMNAQMKLMENEYGVKMDFYKKNKNEEFFDEQTNHPLDEDESDIIQINKKGKSMKLKENNNKKDENDEDTKDKEIEINDIDNNDIDTNEIKNENNDIIDNEENLCVVKIGEQTSERKINEENAN